MVAMEDWARGRMEEMGGPEAADVCEFILSLEDESILRETVHAIFHSAEDADRFLSELAQKRFESKARPAASNKDTMEQEVVEQKKQASSQRTARRNGSDWFAKAGQKAADEESARARLQRNLNRSCSPEPKEEAVRKSSVKLENTNLKAYQKGEDENEFAVLAVEKKQKKKSKSAAASDQSESSSSGNKGNPATKPKLSRAARAEMLASISGEAFLVPGRHPCKWVGNGDEYRLVGNCMDCGKILSNQEGRGPCLVCGSEQVYLAESDCMLDGTPVNQTLFAKRRRGAGNENEMDELDLQLRERNEGEAEAFLSALDLRDRLIDFEQNRAARTTVIDDQADFFDSSSHWLTQEQREKALKAEKAFMDRLNKGRNADPVMFSIDFAGRKILEGDVPQDDLEAADVTSAPARMEADSQGAQANASLSSLSHAGAAPKGPKIDLMGPTLHQDMYLGAQYSRPQGPVSLKNDNLYGRSREIYDLLTEIFKSSSQEKMKVEEPSRSGNILQHERDDSVALMSMDVPEAIREMENFCDDPNQSDDARSECDEPSNSTGLGDIVTEHSDDKGVCLSMHQPWASLVVYGIKKVEGRGWPTSHRGRLWIASTKRRPMQSEVDAVLQQYEDLRQLQGFREPEMLVPEHYPTSVLLGCVDIVDCVSRESFPPDADEEKTECAYGFILDKPCRLSITPKILGQPKIWPLETHMLSRAQKQLRYVVSIR